MLRVFEIRCFTSFYSFFFLRVFCLPYCIMHWAKKRDFYNRKTLFPTMFPFFSRRFLFLQHLLFRGDVFCSRKRFSQKNLYLSNTNRFVVHVFFLFALCFKKRCFFVSKTCFFLQETVITNPKAPLPDQKLLPQVRFLFFLCASSRGTMFLPRSFLF